jgi:hypothetical protein
MGSLPDHQDPEFQRKFQDEAFLKWKGAVNAAVVRKCGLHCDDLPDWPYRDAYDRKMSPHKAAAAVIRNAKDS